MDPIHFHVLIADDEAAIRNGLAQAIPWDDYQAAVIGNAADGESALAFILTHHPDLVVIDIKMPRMDGLEVIRRTRQAGQKTRFLILSGYNDFSLAQKAIRYGANAYFLKPLKIEDFKAELTTQFQEIAQTRHEDPAQLEELLHASRIYFLNQLIHNEIRAQEEILRRCDVMHLNWLSKPSCIVVCSADAGEKLQNVLEAAKDSFAAAFGSRQHEVWIHGADTLVAIVEGDGAVSELSLWKSALVKACDKLSAAFDFRFFAAIGKTMTGPEQAVHSYTTAMRALSYHLYALPGDVYDNDVVCRTEPDFDPAKIDYDPIVSAMELSDRSRIEDVCSEFIQSLFFVPCPPPDFIRAMTVHFINNARIRFLSRVPDYTPALSAPAQEIRNCQTIPAITAFAASSLFLIAEGFRKAKSHADPVIEAAKQYIASHLNTALKAREVAMQVNLSESYFTVYFKQKTGENFRDYVLTARTDLAKKLLTQNRLSVQEIAEATGYQDYRSFSRAFKNITGVSPTDYQRA